MREFGRRLLWVLAFLLVLTATGTAGYVVIEDAHLADAVYMTAITLTAVGYSEVIPLSQAGRTFTMLLLLGGFTWMGLWFAVLTSFIVELDLQHVLRRRGVMRAIENMNDHVIICGLGRTGRQVAEELTAMGQPYVGIERDRDRVEGFFELDPDARIVEGDATVDQSLEEAGIERAMGLVACLSADTDNLFVCLSARDLNSDLAIVARAFEEETMSKMYRAGADHVVSPNVSSAIRIASVMLRPTVVSFLDVATRSADFTLRLEEATIGQHSPIAGRSLAEAAIPKETGLLVIAVRKKAGEDSRFVFNPVGDTHLEPGDQLVVMGSPEQVKRLRAYVESRKGRAG